MKAEDILRETLAHRLQPGSRYRIVLETQVVDDVRHDSVPGPHPIGYVERFATAGTLVRLVRTRATSDARALLEEGLVDVVFDGKVVRLVP